MAESDLIETLRQEYRKLAPAARKQKIRELVAESKEIEESMKKLFPDFYAEAFPSKPHAARAAKPN